LEPFTTILEYRLQRSGKLISSRQILLSGYSKQSLLIFEQDSNKKTNIAPEKKKHKRVTTKNIFQLPIFRRMVSVLGKDILH